MGRERQREREKDREREREPEREVLGQVKGGRQTQQHFGNKPTFGTERRRKTATNNRKLFHPTATSHPTPLRNASKRPTSAAPPCWNASPHPHNSLWHNTPAARVRGGRRGGPVPAYTLHTGVGTAGRGGGGGHGAANAARGDNREDGTRRGAEGVCSGTVHTPSTDFGTAAHVKGCERPTHWSVDERRL